MVELLEADFAQIEHVNQIIHNNMNHDQWSCFDTHFLIREHKKLLERMYSNATTVANLCVGTYDESNPKNSKITKDIKNVRYNSFLVSITKITGGYRYDFEIRNSLWNGDYKIMKSKNTSSEKDVYFDEENIIISKSNQDNNHVSFTILDDSANSVRICFKMNMQSEGRNIQTTSLNIDNKKEFEHQFDKEVCEYGYVKTENGKPVKGVTVEITPTDSAGRDITDGIKKNTAVTDENGRFKMCYSAVSVPGDYYVMMRVQEGSAYDSATSAMLIHIKKTQKQTIKIDWGDNANYEKVVKGSITKYTIPIGINNEYGIHDKTLDSKLIGLNVDVTWIGFGDKRHTQTETIQKNDDGVVCIMPKISYRGYYYDTSQLEIRIPVNEYGAKTETHLVRHIWCIKTTFESLRKECASSDGADWIFLKPGTYSRDSTITLTREITIAGLQGSSHCILDGGGEYIIRINNSNAAEDNYMKVNLVGVTFKNGGCAVTLDTGCRLLVDRCYFVNNKHDDSHQRGCSIYMPTEDKHIKKSKQWKLEVRNSYFYNNRGNEIQSIGKTYIHHSLFKTDKAYYLQQPEVKVVSVRAGSTTYKHNKSHILIPFTNRYDSMPSNNSYAKALAYVEWGATFNGKGPSSLRGDMTLPLYGNPWYNEAYTHCCYYYPYSGINTWIVCYPRVGYERKAAGHSSAIKNWVFYDGYDFVRLSSNAWNRRHPWTEEELAIPDNLGIYDSNKDKFISDDYDPRTKNSKSLTSEV